MTLRRRSAVAAIAAAGLLLAGCGGGGDNGGSAAENTGGKVTFEWWHIGTAEPTKTIYAKWARDYEKQNPNVTIKDMPIENEAFKARLTTLTQSGQTPDVFSTWGGGVLQQQVDAGLVKEITAEEAPWLSNFTTAASAAYRLEDKTYGIPVTIGTVGFWYNKALFKKAGIEQTPTTWAELLDAVKKLKDAGITPIALAGKEKWPGHFYWAYLAIRVGGLPAMQQAAQDKNFNTPDFVTAGQRLKELVDLDPFQKGFLGADYNSPDGQAALVGKGDAAMELMGQWGPSVQKDAGGDLGEDLGFFPFPAVEGGKGAATEAFGGGDGFAVGSKAPAEAVDFLRFISEPEQHRQLVEQNVGLPVIGGIDDAIKDPNFAQVQETLSGATGFQLYLDQAFPPAVGQEINDSVAALIAGQRTPEQVVESITQTAKSE
jgi:raffinose/stachyose/melibiose transport system substrate-binding protein